MMTAATPAIRQEGCVAEGPSIVGLVALVDFLEVGDDLLRVRSAPQVAVALDVPAGLQITERQLLRSAPQRCVRVDLEGAARGAADRDGALGDVDGDHGAADGEVRSLLFLADLRERGRSEAEDEDGESETGREGHRRNPPRARDAPDAVSAVGVSQA